MLKTNSKQARLNIRAYIVENFDGSNYGLNPEPVTFPEIAKVIYETFHAEKYYSLEYMQARKLSEQSVFIDWAAGLPSILDTGYYYNRSAVDDLAAILEETDTEKSRYSEQDAERLLTILIYREILKAAEG